MGKFKKEKAFISIRLLESCFGGEFRAFDRQQFDALIFVCEA